MNLAETLFSFRGRINRARFWLALLIYIVFFFGCLLLVMAVTSSVNATFTTALLLYIPVIASAVSVGVKRLHDRNKSAWWLLLFYLAPIVLQVAGNYSLRGPDASAGGLPYQALMLASFAINVWALVELGCLRGSIGPNPYGPDPVAPAAAPSRTLR